MSECLLQTHNLSKRYGGIVATDNVNLRVAHEETHALIGPNGAGKTTLISLLQGERKPDGGIIEFGGGDVTRVPEYDRARLGLARSFQVISVFSELSVLANVMVAVGSRLGHSYHFWKEAESQSELTEPALEALDTIGLRSRARALASALSYGERRQLELAMALAMQPRLLLLDEPMAGLGRQETARITEILRGLKRRFTILLVEHDMTAVFALADRISVLVNGRIVATDLPSVIRSDPTVRAAYLGRRG
ncbi:ABC transporter ATP-binding protein [Bradyrhizobium sp. 186]|uniref:ABC transporter ATP-binding protein n=1 Tax=Bradyrhizobium sp. 186 TaxID=2782654 RepID=UPI0020012282|nr:ABC transporter ATP-binding protein [Bradyrhizobium sp. 186]UPK38258.1 ABC transporter ATP-binding protein [Bradyrhizobium sp. 186]